MKPLAILGKALPLGLALGAAACGANTDPGPHTEFVGSCDMAMGAGQTCFDLLSDFEATNRLTSGHSWDGSAIWIGDSDLSPSAKSKTAAVWSETTPARGTSTHALHITEDGTHTQWGSVWLVTLNTNRAVDLSGYTGMSFWARSDGPPVMIKVALADSGSYDQIAEPGGQLCSPTDTLVGGLGCYDDYSIRVYPDAVWRRYDIPFSSLTTGGWGLIHPFDPRRIYRLKFAALPQTKYSEWMDDIGFYLRK